MKTGLTTAAYAVFIAYFVIESVYDYVIYHKRKRDEHDVKAYFLAEGHVSWWAIGSSLIACNMSAEQFIGMSREGFFFGIAVAAYKSLAPVALIIITVCFICIYPKPHIYTRSQFLKAPYNDPAARI